MGTHFATSHQKHIIASGAVLLFGSVHLISLDSRHSQFTLLWPSWAWPVGLLSSAISFICRNREHRLAGCNDYHFAIAIPLLVMPRTHRSMEPHTKQRAPITTNRTHKHILKWATRIASIACPNPLFGRTMAIGAIFQANAFNSTCTLLAVLSQCDLPPSWSHIEAIISSRSPRRIVWSMPVQSNSIYTFAVLISIRLMQ